MKIAIIVFGQPRILDNPVCLKALQDKIYVQGSVDVYAHLWKTSNSIYDFSPWARATPASENDISKFQNVWKPVAISVEEQRTFSHPEIFSRISRRFPSRQGNLWWFNENSFSSLLSQLYSLEKAIEVYENNRKENYDWVMVTRTDVCISDNYPKFSELAPHKFYSSTGGNSGYAQHPGGFADLTFVTAPEYVDGLKAYSQLISGAIDIETASIPVPNAEVFKKLSFISKHTSAPLSEVPLHGKIVRSNS